MVLFVWCLCVWVCGCGCNEALAVHVTLKDRPQHIPLVVLFVYVYVCVYVCVYACVSVVNVHVCA